MVWSLVVWFGTYNAWCGVPDVRLSLLLAALQVALAERLISSLTELVAAHEQRAQQAAQRGETARQLAGRATWPQGTGPSGTLPGGQQQQLPPLVLPVVRWASKALSGRPLAMLPHRFEYRVSEAMAGG